MGNSRPHVNNANSDVVFGEPNARPCSLEQWLPPSNAIAAGNLQDTKPIFIRESYKGADKLKGKVAIITGGLLLLRLLLLLLLLLGHQHRIVVRPASV
jgi:hypothetical protein